MHRSVVVGTYVALFMSLVLAVASYLRTPDFDRASVALSLLAAVTGLVLDRWVSARERRRELLRALVHEVFVNLSTFALPELDPGNPPDLARSYPRLATVCLDSAISSGVFTESRDAALNKAMYDWRQRALTFNQKLDLTEGLVMAACDLDSLKKLHVSVTTSSTTLIAKRDLAAISTMLVDRYAKETGVDRTTTLFQTA